ASRRDCHVLPGAPAGTAPPRSAGSLRPDRLARCQRAAGSAAVDRIADYRRANRQANRLRGRRARHRRARTARGSWEGRGCVFIVSGGGCGSDGGFGCGGDHAAEIDVVRAKASGRTVDPCDLKKSKREARRGPAGASTHVRIPMKVLVADKFEQSGLDGLNAAGCDVVYQPDLKDDALAEAIKATAADVLVVRSTVVTAAMLEAGSLTLVVRAGAGYNTIDVATASKRGIYVSNCPGKNAIAVAELAFALLLAIDRRVPDNVSELRAGTWNKKEFSKARGLFGRTIGLLG